MTDDEMDVDVDAIDAYCEAKARSRQLRAEWVELGSPSMTKGGSTGQVLVPHPLLASMRLAEQHEAKLREQLRRRHSGPAPSAVLGIGLSASARRRRDGEPPRVTLRAAQGGGS
jgi:hypothetical protein